MSHRVHRRQGPRSVRCAVLTVSDTRNKATDRSGRWLREALVRAGHEVRSHHIVRDETRAIRAQLRRLARRDSPVQVIVVTGGTGIAPRDRTVEAVVALLEKRLDGFGEIFRALSFRAIGPAAMLSRAVAGTFRGRVIFVLPGSEAAVRLGMRRLILPDLPHIAGLAGKRT